MKKSRRGIVHVVGFNGSIFVGSFGELKNLISSEHDNRMED